MCAQDKQARDQYPVNTQKMLRRPPALFDGESAASSK
jgi:hypothetical protein